MTLVFSNYFKLLRKKDITQSIYLYMCIMQKCQTWNEIHRVTKGDTPLLKNKAYHFIALLFKIEN